jgi:alkylation response protein AidB-like acyl-CoA dehydrogenase
MGTLSAAEVRAALDDLLPRRTASTRLTSMGAGSDDLQSGRDYLAAMAPGGWAVPSWPADQGGRGADADDAATIGSVMREYVVPDLYPFAIGLGMVGPALLAHGTPEQQQRYLLAIADGSEIWCQMFSEPDAGSDLANVGTRAERDGDEWVVSGQKVWTSRAMWARWGILLARTDPTVPKHRGMSMFVVDMEADGVEVRPLRQMNGDQHFSEVFLHEARVGDADRVGDVAEGWSVAMTILAHERAGVSRGGGDGEARGARLPGWIDDLRAQGVLGDALNRQRVVAVHIADQTSKYTARRAAAASRPGPAGSGQKLRGSQGYQARAYTVTDLQGAEGMLTSSHGHIELMTAPSMSIRGGTDEIQRNILGERVLGLPGEPRVDRDVAWSESRKGVI